MGSYYFLGIGGTAMASVSIALSRAGHTVTGSDTQLYPPMSTALEANAIVHAVGYDEANIAALEPGTTIVVGNAISRGNPELEYALEQHLDLIAMPELVGRQLIGRNRSVVVTGTHGKTTTTSLVAWLLEHAGMQPGFLIGGIPENFGTGCRAATGTSGGVFVSEGDEYDTAFFDKRSKFMHYRPDIAIVNNIEFDHADIFNSIDDIIRSFRLFVRLVPRNGLLLLNSDDPLASDLANDALCQVEHYGLTGTPEWSASGITSVAEGSRFELLHHGKACATVTVPLFGNYNVMNTVAALAAAHHCGADLRQLADGLLSFQRPKRRMELIGTLSGGITFIEDFAHHPTAVALTLEALAARYPGRRIVACFEPRSNTTTRNIFQQEFPAAFNNAGVVIIGKVFRPERYGPSGALDTAQLKKELEASGKKVFCGGLAGDDYPLDIVRYLQETLLPEDLLVLLSNGSFNNLKNLLLDHFEQKS